VRIEQFPDVIIAGKFGFSQYYLLEFGEQERTDVNIGTLFAG
jgi:LemA protein